MICEFRAPVAPQNLDPGGARPGRRLSPASDDDGKLEPFCPVDRHDPHGVVIGLGEDGLAPGVLAPLDVHPGQVAAEIAAVRSVNCRAWSARTGAGATHRGAPLVEGQLERPAPLDRTRLDEGADIAPPALLVEVCKGGHPRRTGPGPEGLGGGLAIVPTTSGERNAMRSSSPHPKAERSAATTAYLVGGVVDRPEDGEQVDDLGGRSTSEPRPGRAGRVVERPFERGPGGAGRDRAR